MTTQGKALAILKRIKLLTQEGHTVTFTGDFFDEITIFIDDHHHHIPAGLSVSDDDLIHDFYINLKYPMYDEVGENDDAASE